MKKTILAVICISILTSLNVSAQTNKEQLTPLAEKLMKMTDGAQWTRRDSIKLKFNAHHTQGIVKVGDNFFMSAVEVIRWPRGFGKVQENGLDRDAGLGKGHIFKFDAKGNLLADLPIGEGDTYHPGGLDYDGKYIWIPVTEYRPNSFSRIYRLDPETMEVVEVLQYPESIGAIIHNTDNNTLTGVNWGARHFYTWKLDKQKTKVLNAKETPAKLGVENPSFYVFFQDGKYIGNNMMLGSGHAYYKNEKGSLRLGGWEVFDLKTYLPRRSIPVNIVSPCCDASMLNNPCDVEATSDGLRAYFVPDDDNKSVLYIYDITIK